LATVEPALTEVWSGEISTPDRAASKRTLAARPLFVTEACFIAASRSRFGTFLGDTATSL
jgi:hypothetical protein